MKTLLGIIIGLLVLTFLVVVHEFGHFLAARKNGITVNEFGIGFPPRAIAWQKGKDNKWHRLKKSEWQATGQKTGSLIISLNWLPIGGFCQMDGESGADTTKGTFGAASFLKKTKILFAGVLMNWLCAFLIFTVLAWTGMPDFLNNQFTISSDAHRDAPTISIFEVLENSPAAQAGFLPGDKIMLINNQHVSSVAELNSFNAEHAQETVEYTIQRNDETLILSPTLNPADAEYRLGATLSATIPRARYTWSAPLVGLGLTAQVTGETFAGLGITLWNFLTGAVRQVSFDTSIRSEGLTALTTAADSFAGPVGILGTIFPSFVDSGLTNLAFLAAIISISLACMNILPLPALDGGRWLLFLIYKIRRKRLPKDTEAKLIGRSFIGLFIFAIFITIIDILRFF